MRKSLHVVTLILLTLAFSTAALADAETSSSSPSGVVNINTASVSELTLLPRIGEKGAQRIIEYRTEHGPFKKAADLMQVKGVGAKTFELMSPYLTVSGATTLTTKVRTPRKPRAKKPAPSASN